MLKKGVKKISVKILPILMLVLIGICGVSATTAYADDEEVTAVASDNTGDQSYTTYYATQPYSYLTETDDGFMRVEYISGSIVVEYYDSDYNILSSQSVDMELTYFGGFYAGEDVYYIVFGQKNTDLDDDVEVVRVVKYSTDWERMGAASLYGANTYIPFEAGSCRMTEYGGYLYIRTCHEMYSYHQASLTIQVKESDMTIADSDYEYADNSYGYISHSFNQFIMVDDSANLIALDHGDAYPRSAVLTKYNTSAGNSTFSGKTSYIELMTFNGTIYNNFTRASLGGLEYSSTSYLVAGNSVTQDDDWSSHTARNVFIAVTSRSNFTSGGTEIIWITDYDTDGTISASTPQLVKISDDSFLLLWTTSECENSSVAYSKMTKLHYVYLDGEGNTTSDIYTVDGQLSDCQPIVTDGEEVVWYVTGDSSTYGSVSTNPIFYSISSNGDFSVNYSIEAPENVNIDTSSGTLDISWDAVEGAEGYYVYYAYESNCTKKAIADGETTSISISVTKGYTYYVWVEAYSGNSKSLAQEKQEVMLPTSSTAANGIQLNWGAMNNAESYQVYKKNDDETYELIQTVTDTSWIDEDVSSGEAYTYKVVVLLSDGTTYETCELSAYYLDAPELLSISNVTKGIQLTWNTVDGASRYYIYYTSTGFSGTKSTYTTSGSEETQTYTYSSSTYLTSGETFTFYIKAYNSSESTYSVASDSLSIYYLSAPSVTIADDEESAILSWDEVTAASGYYVYKKEGLGDYELIETTTEVAFTDSNVSDDELYTYQVFAYCDEGISGGSAEVNWGSTDINNCEFSLSQDEYTYNGSSKSPTVTVKYGTQTLTKNTDYTVTYTNNRYPGTATVTVTGAGNFTGTATLYFTINKASNTLTATIADEELTVGDTTSITTSGGNGTKTYETDNSDVATVSSSGVVTATGVGTATITVNAAGNSYYESGSVSFEIMVNPIDLSDSNITLDEASYSYDGTAKNPELTVICSSTTLVQDTDYTVTYPDSKNVGSYTVTVTGKGNYTGTATAEYEIIQADISDCEISLSEDEYTYDGTEKTPTATVTNGSVTLEEGIDYTVAYKNNVDVGTGAVVINGQNNYQGTIQKEFAIRTSISDYTITLSDDEYTYDGTEKEPSVTVALGGTVLAEENYTVTYSDNVNVGTATVTVTGTGNYKDSISTEFVISKAKQIIKLIVPTTTVAVDGFVTVKATASETGFTAESSDEDIVTVEASENAEDTFVITGVSIGTATITITSVSNNYKQVSGYVEITVTEGTDFSDCELLLETDYNYTYDGTKKEPAITVTYGDEILTENVDYVVTYENNVNAGTATVIVTGMGIYVGTITETFTIEESVDDTGNITEEDKTTDNTYNTTENNKTTDNTDKTTENNKTNNIDYTANNTEAATEAENTIGETFSSNDMKYEITSSGKVTVTGYTSTSATMVTIPATVTYGGVTYKVTAIGDGAFAGNTKLKTVIIGDNVTEIGSKAFYKCASLTEVKGCTAVKTIGSKAFCKCKSITCIKLTSKKLTKIGASAFRGCTSLKKFVCKSKKLTKIGAKAFYGDKKLASVTFKTKKLTTSKVKAKAFKGIKKTCTFKVPSSKVTAYKKLFKARGAGSKIKVK